MAEIGERFDSLYPNRQTPPSLKQVGGSNTLDKWDEVYSTSGNFANLVVNNGTADRRVPGMYTATVNFVGGTALTVTHNLNNSNPIIQVYGSGLNQQLPFGSGTVNQALPSPQSIVVSASGSSANAVQITVTSGVAGAKVVIFG